MAKLIELIKELNERTGAGLMDCKKALVENGEDMQKAISWLREKGIAKQAKKEGRIAAEGLTIATIEGDKAVILEINSETDFVAKSDPFVELVEKAAAIALKNNLDSVEKLQANAEYVEVFNDAALKLGEKLSLRRLDFIKAAAGNILNKYIHMKGKISVIVELQGGDLEVAKDIAMNVAANNPQYTYESDISKEVFNKELEVQKALTVEKDPKFASKPADMQEKILTGKVNKVLFESVLEDEEVVRNPDLTVKQLLANKNAKVIRFVRYQVGEGLEKRVDNFAEEVMAQTK